MIIILFFLIIIYFIIKANKIAFSGEQQNVHKKDKKIKFTENYEIINDDSKNNTKKPFYSATWYPSTYLSSSLEKKNNNLKNIYEITNDMNLNPKMEDEKEIDFQNISNDKIKDIYDGLTDNFKNYEKKKEIKGHDGQDQDNIRKGASELSYYVPDNWIYENEEIINGGLIIDGLTGYDALSITETAIY